MDDQISFNYCYNDGHGGTNIHMHVNTIFVGDIIEKFSEFLRAMGYDYMRMYTTEDGEWVFDKNNHLNYSGTCDCDEEYEYDEDEDDEWSEDDEDEE